MKLSGLMFGEGVQDKKFIIALMSLRKFKYYTQNWNEFNYDNSTGKFPGNVLESCANSVKGKDYDLVICFVDLDKLKTDYPKDWEKKKEELEKKYNEEDIRIFWHNDKLEDEMNKIIKLDKKKGKKKIRSESHKRIKEFVNSQYWERLIKMIKEAE